MNKKFTTLESRKSKNLEEYLIVDELPSQFRYYNTDKIYLRGLYLIESESLAQYTSTGNTRDNLEHIINIYDDVIQGIDILELEFMDFLVLVTISSILTISDFGWQTDIYCQNTVDNYHIDEMKNKLEELKNKVKEKKDLLEKETDDKSIKLLNTVIDNLNEQIKELNNDIINAPDKIICETKINEPITINDFDFSEPIKNEIFTTIKNNRVRVKPLLVKDIIEIDKLKEKYKEKYLIIASHIDTNESLEEKVNKILYSKKSEIEDLIKLANEIEIIQQPVYKQCPRCGHKNKVYINLDKVKVYP